MDKNAVLSSTGNKKPRFFYGYIVVMAAFFIMIIIPGLGYSFGVFFKPMSAEFGWTRAMTSGAYSLGIFVTGLLFIVTGRLSDRFGPRIVMVACGLLTGLGCFLMSRTTALWQLYLFWGVILAIGRSGAFVPLASTVAKWFATRRGLMTGIVLSGTGVGNIIVPPTANWLISNYGWRTSFIAIGITASVLLVIAAQFLKRDPSETGELPYGEDKAKQENVISEVQGFSFREAIHTRQFFTVCTIYFFFGVGLHTFMVHIVPRITDLGIPAMVAANILATSGGLGIVGRIGIGSLSDRVGRKSSLIISFILLLVALLWLTVATELWTLYLCAAIYGLGAGGVIALSSPITAELFGLRAHGVIMGASAFAATVGGAIGSVLAGRIFDTTGSYFLAFLVSAALAIASLILASLLKPIASKV